MKKVGKIRMNTGRCIHELELIRIIIRSNGWQVGRAVSFRKYTRRITKEIWFGSGMDCRRKVRVSDPADLLELKDRKGVLVNKIPGLDVRERES